MFVRRVSTERLRSSSPAGRAGARVRRASTSSSRLRSTTSCWARGSLPIRKSQSKKGCLTRWRLAAALHHSSGARAKRAGRHRSERRLLQLLVRQRHSELCRDSKGGPNPMGGFGESRLWPWPPTTPVIPALSGGRPVPGSGCDSRERHPPRQVHDHDEHGEVANQRETREVVRGVGGKPEERAQSQRARE